jgi:hypothetical protein
MGIELNVKVPVVPVCVVALVGSVLTEAPAIGAPLASTTVPAIEPVSRPGEPFEPEQAASTIKRSTTAPGASLRIPSLLARTRTGFECMTMKLFTRPRPYPGIRSFTYFLANACAETR